MELQELRDRTGIDVRRLRYCLDHELVPGVQIRKAPGQAGRPRRFATDIGFGIVCAARLLALGLPHEKIRGFLKGLLALSISGKEGVESVLSAVLKRPAAALAHLGDGVNVRVVIDEYDYDSWWIAPGNPATLTADYKPMVVVTLDIGQIRDQVFGR